MKNTVKKITLKNGLRIMLVPQPANLAATVLILVQAGSEYEEKKQNGVSHFLEHMMFKGTTDRPEPGMIAHELAALGAQSNAFTGEEYTGYYAKAQAEKLPKILEIVSDLYLNPLFDAEEIEKERGVIIQEINMYEDDLPARVAACVQSARVRRPAGGMGRRRREADHQAALPRADFVAYRDRALRDAGNGRRRGGKVRGEGDGRADRKIFRRACRAAARPRKRKRRSGNRRRR